VHDPEVADVSLTSQLHYGALGAWCAASLAGTPTLVDEAQAAAVGHPPVRPPGDVVDRDHWATIGGAFGHRLAFAVAHQPPYAAYLGAARAGLLGGSTLHRVLTRWPCFPDLGADPLDDQPGTADALIDSFTEQLIDYLAEHAVPGMIAASRRAEEILARACWVLTGWEDAYRNGALPPAIARAYEELPWTPAQEDAEATRAAVDLLLLRTPVHLTQELVTLAGRLHTSGCLDQLLALAGNPPAGAALGVTQPVFVPHWADGDVIVGDTLLDVKTVISLRDRDQVARWLYQLLGYAWLDSTAHLYGIRNVGLYLARHGVLVTWPLDYFEQTLVHIPGCVPPARREFLSHAVDVSTLECAVRFDTPAARTRTTV
jgi:hypothetical protein